MEANEALSASKTEEKTEQSTEGQEVTAHIARDLRGATLTFVRKSDAQYLGRVTFEATAQEHIAGIGKLFAAFCENQPSRIQMPGPPGANLRATNGAGRG